jgi:hypothetical protein
MADQSEDPFSSLHSLEETFYQSGYSLGVADGSRAGRIEGRIFGLQKGFEKFVDLGKLAARSNIWVKRIPKKPTRQDDVEKNDEKANDATLSDSASKPTQALEDESSHGTLLPFLPANERLEKHVDTMWALIEPATFSKQNTEETIADFDDRFKRATAKAKVIEKIVGEPPLEETTAGADNIPGRKHEIRVTREQRAEKNIEDFGAFVRP